MARNESRRDESQPKGKKPKTTPEPARRRVRALSDSAGETPKSDHVSAEERYRMIAEAAYFRAQQRGFSGDPLQDWLEAEAEVAVRLGEVVVDRSDSAVLPRG